MKNRELYSRDPFDLDLLNNGVAVVTDEQTEAELRTLRFELQTFVCDGEYARGMTRVLNAFLGHLDSPEQPGVWVSGFYGCGKSHFAKMLRALWVDYRFPGDGATATGLAHLPDEVSILLKELGTAGKRLGGLHAASGTLGAGANNNVRLALLNLVFRSVGLPGQYPLARFVMWLRDNGHLDEVRQTVEASGRVWEDELHDLYVSPVIAGAVHQAQPDLADSPKEVRQLLKAQYPNVDDVPVDEMVAAIKKALAPKGTFPLTLIAIDEVQQFIDEQSTRAYAIQEVTEACCKRFGGKLLFVATGQTALSGTPLLQKLLGRFPTSVELSDTDVETVIRKVILAKKPGCLKTIDDELLKDVGEISRHLQGTKLEHRDTDRETWVSDYPLLPVRRRFWERTLRAVDQAGTTGQLRNQLSVVHEATRATADRPLGSVVAADFIYDQQEAKLAQSGALPREIYEQVRTLRSGNEDDTFNARILGLVFLIGKLPREAGSDTGVRATPEMLADLLVEDLGAGSAPLRQRVPAALKQLEDAGLVMAVGDEYRLQTRESSAWNSEFRDQYNKVANDPQRLASERSDVLRKAAGDRLKLVKLAQGGSKEPRAITPHFGATTPPPDKRAITVWVRDGWDDDERSVEADARAAGPEASTVFVFLPKRSPDEVRRALATFRAAENTLAVRGVPETPEGKDARRSMQTRRDTAQSDLDGLVGHILSGARVFLGGGTEVTGRSLTEAVQSAAESALVRLYREFDVADHTGWAKVLERSRKGSGDALEAVGHKGDPPAHPVCAKLLTFVGAGKKGAEIRAELDAAPYGWPRDAIDGAVYALLATGHLRARDAAGNATDARSLERAKLTQTAFRVESTTVSASQRIKVRKLLQGVGVSVQPNKEIDAVPGLLEELRSRAESAGGEPPLPERPSTAHLDDLQQQTGNDLLIAVFNARDQLEREAADWKARADLAAARRPRWETAEGLLTAIQTLPDAQPILQQAQVVRDSRLLLSDPDPVPAILDQATDCARKALVAAHDAFRTAFDKGMQLLEADDAWRSLDKSQQEQILKACSLSNPPDPRTGSAEEVLESLELAPLDTWRDRTAALAGRFDSARLEAAKLLEPEAKKVSLPSRTLRTDGDVSQWLEEAETLLRDGVKNGPLVV
jgi:hypothetical protein